MSDSNFQTRHWSLNIVFFLVSWTGFSHGMRWTPCSAPVECQCWRGRPRTTRTPWKLAGANSSATRPPSFRERNRLHALMNSFETTLRVETINRNSCCNMTISCKSISISCARSAQLHHRRRTLTRTPSSSIGHPKCRNRPSERRETAFFDTKRRNLRREGGCKISLLGHSGQMDLMHRPGPRTAATSSFLLMQHDTGWPTRWISVLF